MQIEITLHNALGSSCDCWRLGFRETCYKQPCGSPRRILEEFFAVSRGLHTEITSSWIM
ncbi:hypothetical protein M413DRAFT_136349 [Hebeloma cylindrosporum]|uniref:Uncharacterized protein n=1 Tax=Hebeloma cylindrosporum TaxID=76867 RepID=A0A0C3BYP2_HEBCY|nr:hypothetical protein M413DRAFT_136349 [Hebeloma cylindrosporum h7]